MLKSGFKNKCRARARFSKWGPFTTLCREATVRCLLPGLFRVKWDKSPRCLLLNELHSGKPPRGHLHGEVADSQGQLWTKSKPLLRTQRPCKLQPVFSCYGIDHQPAHRQAPCGAIVHIICVYEKTFNRRSKCLLADFAEVSFSLLFPLKTFTSILHLKISDFLIFFKLNLLFLLVRKASVDFENKHRLHQKTSCFLHFLKRAFFPEMQRYQWQKTHFSKTEKSGSFLDINVL